MKRLWRLWTQFVSTVALIPGEVALGIEAREQVRRMHAVTGFGNVDDLIDAWTDAERRASVEEGQASTCLYCGAWIKGGSGGWHDTTGREVCAGSSTGFHEKDSRLEPNR